MSIEDNKSIARRFVEQVWGQGNLSVADEIMSPACVAHNPGPGLKGDRQGHHQLLQRVRTTFPNARFVLEDVIADADRVVDRWTMEGTNEGPFAG